MSYITKQTLEFSDGTSLVSDYTFVSTPTNTESMDEIVETPVEETPVEVVPEAPEEVVETPEVVEEAPVEEVSVEAPVAPVEETPTV
jgi:hypothetical protein